MIFFVFNLFLIESYRLNNFVLFYLVKIELKNNLSFIDVF